MKPVPSGASDPDRRPATVAAPEHIEEHGGTTEREEALWCEVVRLRYRIQHLERDLALRDELLVLLREQKRPKGPKPKPHPAVLIPKGYHKCGKFDCGVLIPKQRLYCCRAHSAQQRWETRKHYDQNQREDGTCAIDGLASSE